MSGITISHRISGVPGFGHNAGILAIKAGPFVKLAKDGAMGGFQVSFIHLEMREWFILQNKESQSSHSSFRHAEFFLVVNIKFVPENFRTCVAIRILAHSPDDCLTSKPLKTWEPKHYA
jgi:hypothetical protein